MSLQKQTSLYSILSNGTAIPGQPEAESIKEIRNSALALFKEKGFPTSKNEDWKYTSLIPYLDAELGLNTIEPDEERIRNCINETVIPDMDTYLLVLVNGTIRTDLSDLPDANLISVQPISEAVANGKFAEYLHANTFTGSDGMLALNTALFTDGCYIHIFKNAVVDKPIRLLHIYSAQENVFVQPRHLWVAERNSQAAIFERSVVLKDLSVVAVANVVSRIVLEENARLTHYELQEHSKGERWIHYNRVSQLRGSRYDNFTFSFPEADLIRNNMEIAHDDSGLETHLYGLYLVGDNQLTDNHTAIAHQHPSCESNQLYKGVITGNGKAVFNGKVLVSKEAQLTNAYQQNNNLLLSDKARMYAKPQLEIYADDVKCSHGCTIGQFNPESLFYLRSRGIDEDAAKSLLVEAFAYDITEKIEDPAIKSYIQQIIQNKMAIAVVG